MQRRVVKYTSFGDPRKVTTLVKETISTEIETNEVLVRWLASPVNPLDINKIQGVYMMKPELPAIAGSEGVGRVVKIGSTVTSVEVGDQVVIFALNCPTWADYSVVDEGSLMKIDKRITPKQGATMMINPPTAWVMMKMGGIVSGDWIVQNAANSGVGRAVIQIAKAKGYHTINVVRDRSNIQELKDELLKMGGDIVLTEEELGKRYREFKGRPKLAMNGVGGKSCLQISNLLARGGMLITYGGMGRQPHEISTSALVFNDIKAVGVAISMWMIAEENKEEVERMLREIQDYFVRGILTPPPMDEHSLENFSTALQNSMDGKHPKQIFVLNNDTSKL